MLIIGVFMFLEASNNYLSRGIPRVTFLSATPAKWKVLSVIWVVGYPMLWAATAPTAYPAAANDSLNLRYISLVS